MRCQQRGGVQRVGLVVLAQDAPVVDAVSEDVGLDLVGGVPPRRRELRVAADLGQLRRTVQGDPAHQLGGHVVLGLAAGLPDALVGFAPHLGGAPGLRLHDRPQPPRQALAASRVQQDGVQDGAEHVVLALVERAVADPHRSGARVAGQVIAGGLRQVAPAVDPVHDLQRAGLGRLEVGDELHELVGLPVQVQEVQRLQGERGVAHPGVAVVPVALAAGRLGQRGGQRRHGGPGRHVGEALDGQCRALDRVAPAVVGHPRPSQPGAPEPRGGVHAALASATSAGAASPSAHDRAQ